MTPSTLVAAGHTDSVLCCEVLVGKKLLASGGEDGAICLTDLTSLKPTGRVAQSLGDAVPALCGNPCEEHTFFAAAGQAVLQLDLRRGLGAEAVRRTFQVNQEEVNGLAVTAANGGWLAAGDDSGELQVISLQPAAGAGGDPTAAGSSGSSQAAAAAGGAARPTYKTLRRGHSNICSAVAFRPHRPWELLSGGLDSTVLKWDYSRLRTLHTWSLSGEVTASGGQLFNPPMVHSIAVPQSDDRGLARLMAVARGDGCISVYDADYKPPAAPPAAGGSGSKKGGGSKATRQRPPQPQQRRAQQQEQPATAGAVPGRLALLGREMGGHTAAVNCVAFFAGSNHQQLLSAGNDRRLLQWDWQAAAAAVREAKEAAVEAAEAVEVGAGEGEGEGEPSSTGASLRQGGGGKTAAAEDGTTSGSGEGSPPVLAAEHRHGRKINWVCSADVPGCSYNTFLADTGRQLTALALAHA